MDLERVDFQPVDLEADARKALVERLRGVLKEGTLEWRKEPLRRFVAEIAIDLVGARR